MSVCLSVCCSVCEHISGTITRPNITKFSVHVTRGRGSVLFWWHCDMLFTCGWWFAHNGLYDNTSVSLQRRPCSVDDGPMGGVTIGAAGQNISSAYYTHVTKCMLYTFTQWGMSPSDRIWISLQLCETSQQFKYCGQQLLCMQQAIVTD